MSLHDDAVAQLTRWQGSSVAQRDLRATYLRHLAGHADGLTRDCHPDHITASALVVSDDRTHVLLHLHRRYRIWMQFGGHCEPADATLARAALREAAEESGIPALRLVGDGPVQLSTHEVSCGPLRPSHHLDVRYLAVATTGAEPIISAESVDVRWFRRDRLPAGLDGPLRDLIALSGVV